MSGKGYSSHLICIGAQKAGTSWLYANLVHHPAFCAPGRKELNYFYRDQAFAYEEHFGAVGGSGIRLDVSPNYAAFDGLARRIYAQCPNARILYILRDPVERALSQYPMAVQRGNIPLSMTFRDAFWEDRQAIRTQGLYIRRIREYLQYFTLGRSFLVLPYDRLAQNPADFLDNVLEFCGVEARLNGPWLSERVGRTPVPMDVGPALYREIRDYYASWNEELVRAGILEPPAASWLA